MRVSITQFAHAPPVPSAVVNGVVAGPGGQTGATLLSGVVNVVTVGSAGNGVILNAGIGGGRQTVVNRCGFDLLMYPALGTAIEGYGVNVPATVVNGGNATSIWNGVSIWLAI